MACLIYYHLPNFIFVHLSRLASWREYSCAGLDDMPNKVKERVFDSGVNVGHPLKTDLSIMLEARL